MRRRHRNALPGRRIVDPVHGGNIGDRQGHHGATVRINRAVDEDRIRRRQRLVADRQRPALPFRREPHQRIARQLKAQHHRVGADAGNVPTRQDRGGNLSGTKRLDQVGGIEDQRHLVMPLERRRRRAAGEREGDLEAVPQRGHDGTDRSGLPGRMGLDGAWNGRLRRCRRRRRRRNRHRHAPGR